MSYKDLLVILDANAPARGCIDLAAALAERFAANLVGLYPPMNRWPAQALEHLLQGALLEVGYLQPVELAVRVLVEHVALPEQGFGSRFVEDNAAVVKLGELQRESVQDVGLDVPGDYLRVRTLHAKD